MTIYFERHDPQKNMARYYRLMVAPTLFGEWALIAEWGRTGSPGRVQQHWPQMKNAGRTRRLDRRSSELAGAYRLVTCTEAVETLPALSFAVTWMVCPPAADLRVFQL